MNFGNMKIAVAAYMTRSRTHFVQEGVDLLGLAINQARKWCERDHPFEAARVPAYVDVNLVSGASLTSAYLHDGANPANSVSVNLIEGAYLQQIATGGTFPIDVVNRSVHRRQMKKVTEDVMSVDDPAATSLLAKTGMCGITLVRHGNLVYLVPANATVVGASPVRVYMDIVRWLPDYSADGDTDFFMTDLHDLLLLKSVYRLNFFLKEDERVIISDQAMEKMWASALKWDARQQQGSSDGEY